MKPFITIQELLLGLKTKQFSLPEVISFYQGRIKKYNPTLNAFIDQFSLSTNTIAPLFGIPGALKNNISIANHRTTCGSKILKDYKAPYNATIVNKLLQAGGTILGTTNLDEFAMGASGEFSAFGPSKNPWDLTRTPGGSSCGSAASVCAGLVPWAIGSETGGSVRTPAAFCGLVGLYPTFGRFSRFGLIAFASSTDQVGPLTKTVYDNALIASILSGKDDNDSSSIQEPPCDFTQGLTNTLPGKLTIGVIQEALESDSVDNEIKQAFEQAIKQMEKLGATIKRIKLPNLKYGIATYFVICYAEAASNLYRFDGSLYGSRVKADNLIDMYVKTRQEGFGGEVKRRILLGNFVLSADNKKAYYEKATHVRHAICAEFDEAFKNVDLLMSPTTVTPPFKLGELNSDPIAMYLNDYFLIPNNMAGLPALSLPCGHTKQGLPIGVQFIGPRLQEHLMYKTAYAYEQSTEHHLRNPHD